MADDFFVKSSNWDNSVKLEMTGIFTSEVIKNKSFTKFEEVIEFGCGTGLVGLCLAPMVGAITMIDISPSMLGKLEEKIASEEIVNVNPILGELADYVGEPVDVIIGFMVMHHIENISSLFKEAHAKLKEGGILIIGDLATEDGSFHKGETVPHNGFDIKELSSLATKQGFKNISTKVYDSVHKNGKDYPLFILTAYK